MRTIPVAATLLLATLLLPAPTAGQVTAGARLGWGDGPNSHGVMGLHGKVDVAGPFRLVAELSNQWQPDLCIDSWPTSFRCGYRGWSVHAGASVVPLRLDRVYTEVAALAGGFHRDWGDGEWLATWTVAVEAGVALTDWLWATARLRQSAIEDPMYTDLFDEPVRPRALELGLAVSRP